MRTSDALAPIWAEIEATWPTRGEFELLQVLAHIDELHATGGITTDQFGELSARARSAFVPVHPQAKRGSRGPTLVASRMHAAARTDSRHQANERARAKLGQIRRQLAARQVQRRASLWLRRRTAAATCIQQALRGHLVRLAIVREATLVAATQVQRALRERRTAARVAAATALQARWRAARTRTMLARLARAHAATRVQVTWRGVMARACVAQMHAWRLTAATVLVRAARRWQRVRAEAARHAAAAAAAAAVAAAAAEAASRRHSAAGTLQRGARARAARALLASLSSARELPEAEPAHAAATAGHAQSADVAMRPRHPQAAAAWADAPAIVAAAPTGAPKAVCAAATYDDAAVTPPRTMHTVQSFSPLACAASPLNTSPRQPGQPQPPRARKAALSAPSSHRALALPALPPSSPPRARPDSRELLAPNSERRRSSAGSARPGTRQLSRARSVPPPPVAVRPTTTPSTLPAPSPPAGAAANAVSAMRARSYSTYSVGAPAPASARPQAAAMMAVEEAARAVQELLERAAAREASKADLDAGARTTGAYAHAPIEPSSSSSAKSAHRPGSAYAEHPPRAGRGRVPSARRHLALPSLGGGSSGAHSAGRGRTDRLQVAGTHAYRQQQHDRAFSSVSSSG